MRLSRGYLDVFKKPQVGLMVALELEKRSEPPVTFITTIPLRHKRHHRKIINTTKLIVDY